MGQFDSLGATLGSALASAGLTADVTHISVGAGSRDLATGVTAPTETSTTIKAVIGACRRELRQGVGVEAGDQMLTVPGDAFTTAPEIGDRFTVAGRGYLAVAVNEVRAGAAIAVYSIQARRA